MSKNICDSCLNVDGCWVDCDRKKQEMKETDVIKNDCSKQAIKKVIPFNDCPHDEVELDLANKYEIVIREGKTFVVKKKPQYPKTYEECCKILEVESEFTIYDLTVCEMDFLKSIIKLKDCRNAYWMIADFWRPNWEDKTEKYYTIKYDGVNIECCNNTDVYSILAFPTAEMRDAFYENFKDLIEQCKELL